MMISFTMEETIFPKDAPIIIPIAMSSTLPRIANSLNSFNIKYPQNESAFNEKMQFNTLQKNVNKLPGEISTDNNGT